MRRASRGRGGWLSLWMTLPYLCLTYCPSFGRGGVAENEGQDRDPGPLPLLPYLFL